MPLRISSLPNWRPFGDVPMPECPPCPSGASCKPCIGGSTDFQVPPLLVDGHSTAPTDPRVKYGVAAAGLTAIVLVGAAVYWGTQQAKPNCAGGGHDYRWHRRNGDWTRMRTFTGWRTTPEVDPINPAQARAIVATLKRRVLAAQGDVESAYAREDFALAERLEGRLRRLLNNIAEWEQFT